MVLYVSRFLQSVQWNQCYQYLFNHSVLITRNFNFSRIHHQWCELICWCYIRSFYCWPWFRIPINDDYCTVYYGIFHSSCRYFSSIQVWYTSSSMHKSFPNYIPSSNGKLVLALRTISNNDWVWILNGISSYLVMCTFYVPVHLISH